MKSSVYKGITFIIAFLGIISGIVLGNTLGIGDSFNFIAMFSSWISTALVCAIFLGIAFILEHLERLNNNIPTPAKEPLMQNPNTDSAKPVFTDQAPVRRKAGANEWECPKCGTINRNYVGTCGCGERKP